MIILLVITTVIALAITIPQAVFSLTLRNFCGSCRYDVAGLTLPCVCPECGTWCLPETVKKTRTIWRWDLAPRVFAAVGIASFSPVIPAAAMSLMLKWHYGWAWEACWYQTVERDFQFSIGVAVPFFLNSLALLIRWGLDASTIRLGAAHPRFWRRWVFSNGFGFAACLVAGYAAYLHRMQDGWIGPLAKSLGLIAVGMGVGWILSGMGSTKPPPLPNTPPTNSR